METLAATAVQFAFLAGVFGALQACFPRWSGQGIFRSQWKSDLAFFLGQHLLWIGLEVGAVLWVRARLTGVVPTTLLTAFRAQPALLQGLELVLAGDLTIYAFHRASHAVPFLWMFHRVHHSAPRLDWLAAHREHPVDGLLTRLFVNLPALLFQVSLPWLAGLVAFRGLWAVFIHSNVKIPLGPLRPLLGAPELHHWHHRSTSTGVKNFANLAPWVDILFGTYENPGNAPVEIGLPGRPVKSYFGWILRPDRITAGRITEPARP